jgi:hypothetical protein
MPHNLDMKKKKSAKDHPAVKGLKHTKSAPPQHSGQALHTEVPKMKPKELTDPTLGLKNAIKLKGIESLALKAAAV